MSGRVVARIATFIGVAAVAGGVAYSIEGQQHPSLTQMEIIVGVALFSGILAVALIPFIIIAPYHWMREQIRRADVSDLIAAAVGLVIGLIVAAVLTIPLSQLTFWNLNRVLPALAALLFAYLGIATAVLRKEDFGRLATDASNVRATRRALAQQREEQEREEQEHEDHEDRGRLRDRLPGGRKGNRHSGDRILVDTSAIIDGRIADICLTGFISATLVVPRFVLEELQHIADSSDSMRRNRGRRGLEILQRLQKDSLAPVEISDADADTPEVDAKLVKLARQWHCSIITNDFNLNRVAELQGVKVLNINELAHAVKPILLPGEEMNITIMQDGKEPGQGVGYLDDGTMIVVEGGKAHMGEDTDVVVTRVLQTVAGRMIFAHPKQQAPGSVATMRRAGTA